MMRSFICGLVTVLPLWGLPDGFEINTFAEPFDIEYPTALTAAADGTVYVSVDRNGSLGKVKGGMGSVVACRDTDGDGKADRFTKFVPDVDSPRGGDFAGGTLYLIHPPYLSAFRDTTGDGEADEHKVLLENIGFGLNHPRGADHTTNGCKMGIDGWIYIAVGDFGMEGTKGTDGRVVTLHGGGVARVRPDGTDLEVFSYYTRNICDVAISPYLDLFTRDNTNDGKGWNIRVHHFTNGSDHGYPRLYKNFADEAVKPVLDLGGGSGTGALYLHEPGMPGNYGEMLFTCDWTTGRIYEHALQPFEATYTMGQEDFMQLGRAIDIDVDGESRLYVCDWRGGGFKFGGEGKKVGLVQRIVPTGAKVEKWPDLSTAGGAGLVGQLAHRSAVRRREAQWELLKRGATPELAEGLFGLMKDASQPLYGRVAAIFTFKQLFGEKGNTYLAELLKDDAVREFVLRAIADRKGELEGVPSIWFREALRDPNPRVRLQAVVGLQRLGTTDGAEDIIELAAAGWEARAKLGKGEDHRIPHASVRALARTGAWEACLAAVADPKQRTVALRALQRMHRDEVVEGLAGILATAGEDGALRFAVMSALARLCHTEGEWDKKAWWGTRPDDRGPYFLVTDWSGTPKVKRVLEAGFGGLAQADRSRMLEVFARNRIEVSALTLGDQDPLQVALMTPVPDKGQVVLLTNAALDRKREWNERLESYVALRRAGAGVVLRNQVGILSRWLEEPAHAADTERELADFINEPTLVAHLRNLRTIARKENRGMSRVAWRAILTISQSPLVQEKVKQQATEMAKDNPREEGFFLALADMKLAGFDDQIAAAIASDNDTLIAAAENARKVIAAVSASEGKRVAGMDTKDVLKAAMESTGDPGRGRELFTRQGCVACHAVEQAAVQKGPYLGSAGSKFTRDYLIMSILDPNAVVAQGFQTELITLKNGMVHMGFVTREEDGVIEIRNVAGIASELKEADVKSRVSQPMSMMPPGLAGALSVGEFVDLVEYLASMKE